MPACQPSLHSTIATMNFFCLRWPAFASVIVHANYCICQFPFLFLSRLHHTKYIYKLGYTALLFFRNVSLLLPAVTKTKNNKDDHDDSYTEMMTLMTRMMTVMLIMMIIMTDMLTMMIMMTVMLTMTTMMTIMLTMMTMMTVMLTMMIMMTVMLTMMTMMQGWASVLFKRTFRSLRFFAFLIKERSVLSVRLRSL